MITPTDEAFSPSRLANVGRLPRVTRTSFLVLRPREHSVLSSRVQLVLDSQALDSQVQLVLGCRVLD